MRSDIYTRSQQEQHGARGGILFHLTAAFNQSERVMSLTIS